MQVPFRAISVFHAAAQAGSVSRAAEALGITASAVSQQVQALERHLGTALMVKVGRGVKLTEAGERYFEMIADDLERITDATNRLRGQRLVATLNIRATPSLSTKWLLPRLASYLDAHPETQVRLDGTNEPTDFAKDGVDVEIRHGQGRWPGFFVEGLVEEQFYPVCSPSHSAAGSLSPADVPHYRLIQSVKSQVQWPAWFSAAGLVPRERLRRVLFDRSHMAIDAAVAGMGIALESNLMMWRELQQGTLVSPVRNPPPVARTTQWIVCPREHLRRAKVRSFLEWLAAQRDEWQATENQRRAGIV